MAPCALPLAERERCARQRGIHERVRLADPLIFSIVRIQEMVKLSASIHSSFSEMVTDDLRRRNVTTVVDFIATDPVKLATFTGLSHMTIEDALQRTKVYHVRSSHQMIQALRHLVSFYKTERNSVLERKRPLLVIIDSLPAVIFKVTRDTRHSDLETTYELDDLAEVCRFLTRECQAVVITVNSVTRWDSTKKDDLSILTPALGKHWARIPVTRLLLTREHGETRRIFVWKDPRFEENPSCVVSVGDAGITML
ncbi:hypothetical protein DMN91_009165 [Ooceraea biroi]|uniref:Uncharacterized protein n=1 Tax=Ooceraea biroi TaxID=2015173 RepID=A0A3L8DFY9_OOCBI|nr:hypothetical protein DMN91_009165 [Ooceraea biroi]